MRIRYALDADKLCSAAKQRGFPTIYSFAAHHKINRTTLNNYTRGKGPLPEPFYMVAEGLGIDPLTLLKPISSPTAWSHVGEILPILTALAPTDSSLAFGLLGSRLRDTAHEYSDWDLGVTHGMEPLPTTQYCKLLDRLDELRDDLPRGIDLLNLDQAPLWFLSALPSDPMFMVGNESRWQFFLGRLHGIRQAQTV